MALGDARNGYNKSSNGNNSNKLFDQTYYSRIKIKNKDKLAVNFTYSKGLLRVEISEEKDGYRYEPLININLSPTKAKLLIAELEEFIGKMKAGEEINPKAAVGVSCGLGDTATFIGFKTTGKRPEVPEHSFIIGKLDNASGEVENAVEFIFNVDYDYSLRWDDIEKMKVTKNIYQFMGIDTFLDILKEFANTSGGGLGAAVLDTGRYDVARILRKMDPIYEKLGIEKKYSGSNNGGSDNFFSRQSSGGFSGMNPPERGHSTNKSFDEIEDMLD